MIEFLRGTLLRKDDNHAIVDVGGVGYGLDIPLTLVRALPAEGQPVEFHVYTYVQEGILRLYGFGSAQERELFETFLGAQGIGPRTALGILSTVDAGTFAQAILRGDLATLTRIPGIGKKTAERLVLDLRQKMKNYANLLPAAAGAGGGKGKGGGVGAGAAGAATGVAALGETVEALEALGVKPMVAERAAQKAYELLGDGASVPDLVREALKHRR